VPAASPSRKAGQEVTVMDVETIAKHKFLEDSNMTFQEVFDFAFKTLIPVLQELAKELGEDHVLEVLGSIASESALKVGQDAARQLPCNDFRAYISWTYKPNHFSRHALTIEVVEDKPQAFEMRITECLFAKTFRGIGAADIGYLLFCNTDYAHCQGFNPQITLLRSQTLMQGDICCSHRYISEG
jgi:hypothetical protein